MPKQKLRVRERLQLRNSKIHGKGVFARVNIPKGERLVEYAGERITEDVGDHRYPYDPEVPYHTFLFTLDDDWLVDGGSRGNVARWINHSCDPNCESVIEDDRIWIESKRAIKKGEELTYDYHFVVPERHTPAVKKRYPCICGSEICRGTMLVPKRK